MNSNPPIGFAPINALYSGDTRAFLSLSDIGAARCSAK